MTRLGVETILVLGHGMCGGVAAALAAAKDRTIGQFIGPWVSQLSGIRETLLEQATDVEPEGHQRALEHLSIKYSLDNLSGFPFVQDAVNHKTLSLHGAWFSIAEGELHWLDQDTGIFEAVTVHEIVE